MAHIAIDLDGTLAEYDGFKGADVIGDPLPGVVEMVKSLFDRGHQLSVFTARAHDGEGRAAVVRWLEAHGMLPHFTHVTAVKRYDFDVILDDRNVRFEGNVAAFETTLLVRPWWKEKR